MFLFQINTYLWIYIIIIDKNTYNFIIIFIYTYQKLGRLDKPPNPTLKTANYNYVQHYSTGYAYGMQKSDFKGA